MDYITLNDRTLVIPKNLASILAVKGDHETKTVHFKIPKTHEEIDLSTYSFYINYLNAENEGDVYHVEDAHVERDDIIFSWILSSNVLKSEGNIHISIRALGEQDRVWGTTIATLYVGNSLNCQKTIYEKDYDFINQQFEKLEELTKQLNDFMTINRKVRLYNTTEEMLTDRFLKTGDKVKTFGYSAINDGGESEFIIEELNESKLQIALKNGLYATLIYSNTIYVSQLGIKNGDMTLLINDLFNKVRSNTKIIFDKQLDITVDFSKLPNNPYPKKRAFIDLLNKDNVYIDFGNSKFSVVSNNYNNYTLCYVDSCNNFKCENGEFVGDRKTHQYSNPQTPSVSDEFGFGFELWASKTMEMNYTINNMNIHDFTGDGIISSNDYQGSYSLCKIKNSHIHHVRRNGIAVLDGNDFEITNCKIHNVGASDGIAGKRPMAGVDIEPAKSINSCIIKDCDIEKCDNYSIVHSILDRVVIVNNLIIENNKLESSVVIETHGNLNFVNNTCAIDKCTWAINADKLYNVSNCTFTMNEQAPMFFRTYESYKTDNVVYNCVFKGKEITKQYQPICGNFNSCKFDTIQMYGNAQSNISVGNLNRCDFKNCKIYIHDGYVIQTPVKFCTFKNCTNEASTSSALNKFFNCIFDTKTFGALTTYKNCSFADEM